MASITSQLDSNLSFLDQSKQLGDMTSQQLGIANKAQGQAQTWGAVAQIASSAYANSDALTAQVKSIFKPK